MIAPYFLYKKYVFTGMVCVCVCVYACEHVCVCMSVCVCYVYLCVSICVYVSICLCVSVGVGMGVPVCVCMCVLTAGFSDCSQQVILVCRLFPGYELTHLQSVSQFCNDKSPPL